MKTVMLFVLTLVTANPLLARGSRVTVALANHQTIKGELLSVRDSFLVIATKEYTEYTVKPGDKSRIAIIRFTDIDSVTAPGQSWRIWGAGFGYFTGAIIGAVIAAPPPPPSDATDYTLPIGKIVAGAAIGSTVGIVAGFVLGDMASLEDATVRTTQPEEILLLKEHARYPESEPEVLQAVQYVTAVN